ncbi:MAG: hypothetical protein R6V12_08500 [Candidatus Hydrogenedentota bacterium]
MRKAAVSKSKNTRVILPDSDKLGFVVASFFATLVLAINVFFLSVHAAEIAFRVTLTFAVSWAATAVMVHYMVSTTVREIRAERAARRRAQMRAEEEMEEETGEGTAPEGTAGERE